MTAHKGATLRFDLTRRRTTIASAVLVACLVGAAIVHAEPPAEEDAGTVEMWSGLKKVQASSLNELKVAPAEPGFIPMRSANWVDPPSLSPRTSERSVPSSNGVEGAGSGTSHLLSAPSPLSPTLNAESVRTVPATGVDRRTPRDADNARYAPNSNHLAPKSSIVRTSHPVPEGSLQREEPEATLQPSIGASSMHPNGDSPTDERPAGSSVAPDAARSKTESSDLAESSFASSLAQIAGVLGALLLGLLVLLLANDFIIRRCTNSLKQMFRVEVIAPKGWVSQTEQAPATPIALIPPRNEDNEDDAKRVPDTQAEDDAPKHARAEQPKIDAPPRRDAALLRHICDQNLQLRKELLMQRTETVA